MHAHFMHFFLGVCTPCAHCFWVNAHFFQTLKIPPFSPSCTGSFPIPVSLIGLITSPTSLDRNSKVFFLVVLKGLKSLHSLHGVHEVCTGLPPDVHHIQTDTLALYEESRAILDSELTMLMETGNARPCCPFRRHSMQNSCWTN